MRQLGHPRGPSPTQPRPRRIPEGAVCLPSCQGHRSHGSTPVIACVSGQVCKHAHSFSLFTHLHEHLLSTRPPGHLVSMNLVVKNADV